MKDQGKHPLVYEGGLFHFLPEPNSSIGSYVRERGGGVE
jgi:hypothetical protein